jgi:DNA-binding NarL/FixJ family response regulator
VPESQPQAKTRVMLVETDAAVRRALRMALELEPDIKVIGEAGNTESAVPLAQILQPDVVLTELLPQSKGAMAKVAELVHAAPCCAVVILSHFDERTNRKEAGALGCAAFVGKHEPHQALLDAIRKAGVGGR